MSEFKLSDPYGTAPVQAPFTQSVSRGVAWNDLPLTREYTIGQLLDQTIARCGANDALFFPDRDYRLTWLELGREVDLVARGLMALGIQRGEKIALWATNVPYWVVLMLAAAKIGAILLPLNTNYKKHELDFSLKQSGAENLVIIEGYRDCDFTKVVRDLVPELGTMPRGMLKSAAFPHLKRVLFMGGTKYRGMYSLDEIKNLAQEVPYADYFARQAELDVNDVVNMQYTSGTTGFPKGVQLTHRNIANDSFWIALAQNFSVKDRLCVPVPLFHCFGCVLGVLCALNQGVTLVFVERFDPIQVLTASEKEKCTAVYGVPTMYIAMLDHPLFDRFDLRSLRTGIMSGAACPVHRMRQVIEKMHMREVCIPYGLTEAGPVMTMTRYFEPSIERKCTTLGQALPGIEVAVIVPETGEIAEIGQDGELCCRGYNNMKGYYNLPEQTAACLDKNGWLHSGDIGRMDAEGYYYITGRLKDLIIRGGENISPKEVEEFLGTMPGVRDVAVVGCPSKKYGEQPAAFIIRSEGSNITAEDVASYCKNQIAWFKIPKYVHFLREFPLTASRKVRKFELREMAHDLWPYA